MSGARDRLLDVLLKLDRRLVLLLMAAVVALIAFQSWVILFRQPVAEYQRVSSSQGSFASAERENASLITQQQALATQVAALEEAVESASSKLPPEALLVELVAQLDRLAVARRVRIGSVKPGASREVPLFEEMSFQVDARGSYGAIFEWLQDIETELRTLSVKGFHITQGSEPGMLNIGLQLAAYRRLAKGPRP